MRKGQAEMLGLAIIVILLIVALMMYLRFSQDKVDIKARSSLRANNALNALMLVNVGTEFTGYEGEQLKDVLKQCSESTDVNVDGVPDECKALIVSIENVFDKILMQNEDFSFTGSQNGDEFIRVERGSCVEGVTASPQRYSGGYVFKLKLCS